MMIDIINEKPLYVAAFLLPLALIYIYMKCPCLVRISGILCSISLVIPFLIDDLEQDDFLVNILSFNLPSTFLLKWTFLIRENTIKFYILFLAACCLRLWWCDMVDFEADSQSIGLKQLKNVAVREGKLITEIIQTYLESKINPYTMVPMIPNSWYALLESNELKIGDTKFVTSLGRCFVITRNEFGLVSVFDTICCHHVKNYIFTDIRKPKNDLTCSVCLQQISEKSSKIRQNEWICEEINNFIFIWFHAENEPPKYHIPTIAEISDGTLVPRARAKQILWTQAQVMAENAADAAHFYCVHGQNLYTDETPKFLNPILKFVTISWSQPKWKIISNKTHIARLNIKGNLCFFGITVYSIVMDVTTYGATLAQFCLKYGIFNIQALIMGTPDNSLQLKTSYYVYSSRSVPQGLMNFLFWLAYSGVYKDSCIWNNMMYMKNPNLVAEEACLKNFRRHYLQFYSKNSPRFHLP